MHNVEDPDSPPQPRRPSSGGPDPVDSGDDAEDPDNDASDHEDDHHDPDATRAPKRKRPISVSCECCKQRKVKCDRGQPSCGWCRRNSVTCEYRERKKPGLRAGYGRELEQRLDKLEEILQAHSEILEGGSFHQYMMMIDSHGGGGNSDSKVRRASHAAAAGAPPSVRNSNPSLPSDHGTPREPPTAGGGGGWSAPLEQPLRTPQAETALFLQKPSTFSASTPQQQQNNVDFGSGGGGGSGGMQSQSHVPMPGFSPAANASLAAHHHSNNATAATATTSPSTHQDHYAASGPSPGLSSSGGGGGGTGGGGAALSSDQDLPPYDLLYALADLFFKHVNTWCPILHRNTTLDSLFGPSTLGEDDRILLHAIVATTLRFSTDARLTDERRRHYHRASKQRVMLYGMEHASVESLRALLILALDLCGDSNGPPGWNIMALITRSVVQLGLAVETNSPSVSPNITSIYTLRAMILPEARDFLEDESRRRLFWMVYVLDRYATLATAFEFALDDKEIDRRLPCRNDLWLKNTRVETRWFNTDSHPHDFATDDGDGPGGGLAARTENLGAFSHYIEILGITSKIHLFLKQPVDISALGDVEQWQLRYKELDATLASWKFSLPGEFGNMAKLYQPISKALGASWVMLHAMYHTAVIRLHSSAAYPTTRSPIFTPSYSASQRCHAAVENIAALCDVVVRSGMLDKLGPPFAFTLWVAARLLLVHGSTVEHGLAPQLALLVDTLRDMGRHWPVAQRYSELLQRVLDEHADSERAVKQTGAERVTPSSVRILADMRRTAFDLDFLISRQPRHVAAANGAGGIAPASAGMSRLPSATPVRTPAPNELEYLDVFDFFNVPRLPFTGVDALGGQTSGGGGAGGEMGDGSGGGDNGGPANEFNITNFMIDANSDWLFKQP